MVRGLKLGDRVKGKRADIRNLVGAVVEVIPRLGPNEFRVRWNNGVVENYLARHLEIVVEAPIAAANILPQQPALAEQGPNQLRQQPGVRNFIAYNQEYDDSDLESNNGSR